MFTILMQRSSPISKYPSSALMTSIDIVQAVSGHFAPWSFRPQSPRVSSLHTKVTSLQLKLDWFWTYVSSGLLTNAASSRVRLYLVTQNIISFDYFPQHEFLCVVIPQNPLLEKITSLNKDNLKFARNLYFYEKNCHVFSFSVYSMYWHVLHCWSLLLFYLVSPKGVVCLLFVIVYPGFGRWQWRKSRFLRLQVVAQGLMIHQQQDRQVARRGWT